MRHQTDISAWIRGRRLPLYEEIRDLERALGLPLGTVYRKAGLVDDATDAVDAVRADTRLPRPVRETIVRMIQTERRAAKR